MRAIFALVHSPGAFAVKDRVDVLFGLVQMLVHLLLGDVTAAYLLLELFSERLNLGCLLYTSDAADE